MIFKEIDNMKDVGAICHYYPINGKAVCGLHVAENLQVITKQENLDKGDKHPDDFYQGV